MDLEASKAYFQRSGAALREIQHSTALLKQDLDADDFQRAWVRLLTEFVRAHKFLQDSAKAIDQKQWAGSLSRDRKENHALNYLFHARNADEHGARPGHEASPAALSIGGAFAFSGTNKNVTMKNCVIVSRLPDGTRVERRVDGQFSTENGNLTEGWIKSGVPVTRERAYLEIIPVLDRGIQYIPPVLPCRKQELAGTLAQICLNWIDAKHSELGKIIKDATKS